jgi:hypothetical protein
VKFSVAGEHVVVGGLWSTSGSSSSVFLCGARCCVCDIGSFNAFMVLVWWFRCFFILVVVSSLTEGHIGQ